MKNKPIILVDGSSYLYRAFHAMPSFTNSHGEHTGAMYGVINMVKRLLREYEPEKIGMVFDAKGKTFRDELFSEYKAHRPSMPEELSAQIIPLYDILTAMGLPPIVIEGVEADDVIGTLTTEATTQGLDVIVSTGDKDLAQLVNKHVCLVNTMNDTTLDENGVVEKFGVGPELIIDYLALVGDSVDNIPGVPKCGPKTAVKWLTTYGNLDSIIEHAGEIKGKVGENLRGALEQLPLSRTLATVKCDVELPFSVTELHHNPPHTDKLIEYFRHFEFKTWLSELLGGEGKSAPEKSKAPVSNDYQIVLSQTDFDHWLEKLRDAELFAFDTETTSLNYIDAEIVGVSFAVQTGEAAYVPVAHNYLGCPQQLDRDQVLAALKPLLEDPEKPKLGQNLKYDMSVLARYDINLRGVRFDTMLESYVLDSVASRHDMDSLSLKYLGHKTIHYEDVAGKGAKQKRFDEVEIEQGGEYAAEDADITLRLHQHLWPELSKTEDLRRVFDEIEIPLVPVLSRLERNGVLVDADLLRAQSKEISHRLKEIEALAFEEAGEPFNLNSPKQIQEIFFEKKKLPVIKKTPKGQPSTAEPVLQELALEYRLPQLILEHRGLAKLRSTYTDKLPEQVNSSTGRVHTSYHQAVAATGRLSSSDPNLQNIPVRTAEGRRIRQAFIAESGYKVVAADYSQIELRIMAHLSSDQGLLNAFNAGVDIHRATAAEIFALSPEDVSSEQRRNAKAINFGLIYGMSAFGLSRQLGIDRGEAQQYMDHYFDRYPGVKDYMESIRAKAHEQGFVETLFGRRLYLPDIKSSNHQRRQYAERTAINAPMQGTAADIIKRAMIQLDDWIQADNPELCMIMQVHDELVFEVAEHHADTLIPKIKTIMEQAATLDVPLEVDVGIGNNWDEAH